MAVWHVQFSFAGLQDVEKDVVCESFECCAA